MLAVLVLLQMWQQQCWHWLLPLPLQQLPQLLGADTLQQQCLYLLGQTAWHPPHTPQRCCTQRLHPGHVRWQGVSWLEEVAHQNLSSSGGGGGASRWCTTRGGHPCLLAQSPRKSHSLVAAAVAEEPCPGCCCGWSTPPLLCPCCWRAPPWGWLGSPSPQLWHRHLADPGSAARCTHSGVEDGGPLPRCSHQGSCHRRHDQQLRPWHMTTAPLQPAVKATSPRLRHMSGDLGYPPFCGCHRDARSCRHALRAPAGVAACPTVRCTGELWGFD